ncbi:expressed unknown protein [Seminavis robusta]|uniref:Uncharacterized protein n=1 Tax=Seminavis robusta TaxID=568900 RepID=A0A9N8E0V5_9STRA|nr:expressed unknown protein [Seminavis robusta]|eukprot:Sro448_g145200.1 n/a (265) ;mRNA; r:47939-48733
MSGSSFGARGGNAFASFPGLTSSNGGLGPSPSPSPSAGAGGGGVGLPSLNSSSSGGGGGQYGPAIESLTLTAQSVGLTIEQLAAALSASPNLKTLSNESGIITDSQKELALSLYRTESLALYRRCMLLAGFDPDAIEEQSPEYQQFAFRAWQEEGRRLQDLMGREMSLQAPVVANLQQEAAQAKAHAQVQSQIQAKAVQAQAQALALEQQQQKQQLFLQSRLQQQQNGGLNSLLYNSSAGSSQLYNDAVQKRLNGMHKPGQAFR